MTRLKALSKFIKQNDKKIRFSLGEINIGKSLGQGGNGAVYEASLNGMELAIKFLITDDKEPKQKRNLDRFIAEYINIIKLNNKKNIVKYIDFDILKLDDDGCPFEIPLIIMEKYEGSLKNIKFEKNVDNFKKLFYFLTKTVAYIHKEGIIHRDIKPENILIKDNEFYLADFGISSFNPDLYKVKAETDKKERLANRLFSAPEQEKNNIPANKTMDIYAIGQLLQWFTYGETHRGTKRNPLAPHYEGLDGIDYVVDKCLANNPENRFQNIEEIFEFLEKMTLQKKEKKPVVYINLFNDILKRNFPRNDTGITNYKSKKKIHRLFLDLKKHLSEFDTYLWWHDGFSNTSISEIKEVNDRIWRFGEKEFFIEDIWIHYDFREYNDFIIIHYLPQNPFIVEGKPILRTALLNGEHHISFSELENNYAEIGDEIIDLTNEHIDVIRRTDKEGYIVISTNFHCILQCANDQIVQDMLNKMLELEITTDMLMLYASNIRANKNRSISE